MNGWLAAAEKLFQRRASRPPPPFELACVCGELVTGTRSAGIQRPTCPVCATELFVLPASVYPPPRTPKRKPLVPRPELPAEEISAEPGMTTEEVVIAPKVLKTAATNPVIE